MKVLLVHNYYQQPGGEDVVFAAERDLLRSRGHEVIEYVDHNSRIADMSRLRLPGTTVWSRHTRRAMHRELARHHPDVAHFHNTFPLISPSAYYACRDAGVPVVQTLHNYRLLCPAATLYREGHACDDCLAHRIPWPAVRHACYRGDRGASATVAAMLTAHRWGGTWARMVDLYLALSEFSRVKFATAGLPSDRIAVKPNFVHPTPAAGAHSGGYALFVGRLVPEKGVQTLLAAWRELGPLGPPLKIVGAGPLARLEELPIGGVEWLGQLPRDEVIGLMQQAMVLIAPSEWYEGGVPLTVIEGFATGLPVIASRLGALADPVINDSTGFHFQCGDPQDLAATVRRAAKHPERLQYMGRAARDVFQAEYTAERSYERLLDAYAQAIRRAHGRAHRLERL